MRLSVLRHTRIFFVCSQLVEKWKLLTRWEGRSKNSLLTVDFLTQQEAQRKTWFQLNCIKMDPKMFIVAFYFMASGSLCCYEGTHNHLHILKHILTALSCRCLKHKVKVFAQKNQADTLLLFPAFYPEQCLQMVLTFSLPLVLAAVSAAHWLSFLNCSSLAFHCLLVWSASLKIAPLSFFLVSILFFGFPV